MDRSTIATAALVLIALTMLSIGAALWLPILSAQREDARINADVEAILAHVPQSKR
jgi:hypothetical protein